MVKSSCCAVFFFFPVLVEYSRTASLTVLSICIFCMCPYSAAVCFCWVWAVFAVFCRVVGSILDGGRVKLQKKVKQTSQKGQWSPGGHLLHEGKRTCLFDAAVEALLVIWFRFSCNLDSGLWCQWFGWQGLAHEVKREGSWKIWDYLSYMAPEMWVLYAKTGRCMPDNLMAIARHGPCKDSSFEIFPAWSLHHCFTSCTMPLIAVIVPAWKPQWLLQQSCISWYCGWPKTTGNDTLTRDMITSKMIWNGVRMKVIQAE